MTTKAKDNRYFFPSEWHHQECVQLTWPHAETDWQPYLDDICETFVQIAKAVAHYERLVIAARHPEEVMSMLAENLNEEEMSRVSVYPCDNNDTWARDHAFISLLPLSHDVHNAAAEAVGDGQCGQRQLLDFRFNGWGEKFAAELDNRVSASLLSQGAIEGERVDYDDFVLEGGSVESDGRGTLLTTSCCLLAPHRNQPMTREDIDMVLRDRLHVRKVVWLDHGQLEGDDTDGHIDTIVRMCPDNVLMYVSCDDASDSHYADFKALESQLRQVENADGEKFRLVRLPMPDPIYDGEERLPATYANFLIINGAVIVPTYDQPAKDAEALEAVASVFRGYDIIGIDSRTIIRQHGSIHCLTMQYPSCAAE